MKYLLLVIVMIFALSCEHHEDSLEYTGYFYSVIRQGTVEDPIWMIEGLRKKGQPYIFIEKDDDIPLLTDEFTYLTSENLVEENAQIVIVEIKIVEIIKSN